MTEKERFVTLAQTGRFTITDLCSDFGISRKTGHKYLLEKDKWDNWVISKDYNAAMLAEAVCKLEGFAYAPSDSLYWQHGHSTERDFIYVTTASLTHAQLAQLSDEVGPERSLYAARNVCAHHSRFWNRVHGYPPMLPNPKSFPAWHGEHKLRNDRSGILIIMCWDFLRKISPTSRWRERVEGLFAEYPDVPTLNLGLPKDWMNHPLWKS